MASIKWDFKDVRGGVEATAKIQCKTCGTWVTVTETIPARGSVAQVTRSLTQAVSAHQSRH